MDPQNPQGNNPPPPPPPPGDRPPPQPPYTPDRPSQPQASQYGQPPTPPQPQPGQPDYRPPGGYVPPDQQPTQVYQSYAPPPQPPQYSDGRQYNINAPKKGTPTWVWGAIGAAVVALIGGGVLLFFLLSPKSNAPAANTTPQPTTSAAQPTTAPRQPTTAPGQPTTVPPRATPGPEQPTEVAQPTAARPQPTSSQGGLVGAPPAQVVTTFFDLIRTGNYEGALALADPDSGMPTTADELRSLWEDVELDNGGKLQSVDLGEATEQGNNAQVALTAHFEGGGTAGQIATLTKKGDSWLISAFHAPSNGSDPTPEFPIPTPEETEVVP